MSEKIKTWWTSYGSIVATAIALCGMFISLYSTHVSNRAANISDEQLRLASYPFLYGDCSITTTDILKTLPAPDLALVAREGAEKLLEHIAFQPGFSPNQNYDKVYPFVLNRCTITNLGKGSALDLKLPIRAQLVNDKLKSGSPVGLSQPQEEIISVPMIAPSATYSFLVANWRPDAILVKPSQKVTYHIDRGSREISEEIKHGIWWNQLTIRNQGRPKKK